MTGYYPCPQDEELLISSTAASIAMQIEGSNLWRERKRLLGSYSIGFGGIMPFHCRALQQNVPTVAGLTDEAILDGSAYHIVAPTYLPDMQEGLLKGIFYGCHKQFRQLFRGHRPLCLQYCVECAREDQKRGNRQCWRVLANIPGNNTCIMHGVLLTTTTAHPGGDSIPHDAGEWINLQSASVTSRNVYDVQLAKDLQWLYQLKSRICPGWKNLAAALTIVFARKPEYRKNRNFLKIAAIANDLGEIGEITKRVAPRFHRCAALAAILHQRERASIPLYSLLGMLAGIDLKGLFDLACDPSMGKNPYANFVAQRTRYWRMKGPRRLKEVKIRLRKYMVENPGVSRTQLNRNCSIEVIYAARHDPIWYAKGMPSPTKGFRIPSDWEYKDKNCHRRLRDAMFERSRLSQLKRVGAKTILRMAGMSALLLFSAKGRLPKTLRFVNNLIRRPDGSLPYNSGCRKKLGLRCM